MPPVDLDEVELDDETKALIDGLKQSQERLRRRAQEPKKPRPIWLRSKRNIVLYYLICGAVGLILGQLLLLITK